MDAKTTSVCKSKVKGQCQDLGIWMSGKIFILHTRKPSKGRKVRSSLNSILWTLNLNSPSFVINKFKVKMLLLTTLLID